ncbi:MAG: hypothetical protein Q4C72_03265 [Eubacteriales bacterium]|nr:hypothetical protein [Eubacteriales bacterium]
MKENYIAPMAELICFKPLSPLTASEGDAFEDMMNLFGDNEDVPTESGDVEVDPWG